MNGLGAPLYRIIYVSRSRVQGDEAMVAEAIRAILAASRANNARDGITGKLLFGENTFAQVLEGPLDMIERTFERIQCDDRHDAVVLLTIEPIEAPDFPQWSMGYDGPEALNPVYRDLLVSLQPDEPEAAGRILNMLRGTLASGERLHWSTPAREAAP